MNVRLWLCYGGNYRGLRQDGLMSSRSKQWEGLDVNLGWGWVLLGNGARRTQRKGDSRLCSWACHQFCFKLTKN